MVQGSLHMDEAIQHSERGKAGAAGGKTHPGLHAKAHRWSMNHIPDHLLVDPEYRFYLPLDRGIRIAQGLFTCFMNEDGLQNIYREIESNNTFMLNANTHAIASSEFERVFIRTTMRKFTRQSVYTHRGGDVDWDSREQKERSSLRSKITNNPVYATANSVQVALLEAEDSILRSSRPLLLNMDDFIALILEKFMIRYHYCEYKLKEYFREYLSARQYMLNYGDFCSLMRPLIPRERFYGLPTAGVGVMGEYAPAPRRRPVGDASLEDRHWMALYTLLLQRNNEKCKLHDAVGLQSVHHASVESLIELCRQFKILQLVSSGVIDGIMCVRACYGACFIVERGLHADGRYVQAAAGSGSGSGGRGVGSACD